MQPRLKRIRTAEVHPGLGFNVTPSKQRRCYLTSRHAKHVYTGEGPPAPGISCVRAILVLMVSCWSLPFREDSL